MIKFVKPKYFPSVVAWYYRNFKYANSPFLFKITFDSYRPELFERLYTHNGITAVYLGGGKYLECERVKNVTNFNNIEKIIV